LGKGENNESCNNKGGAYCSETKGDEYNNVLKIAEREGNIKK
jgi:hypothetical protein